MAAAESRPEEARLGPNPVITEQGPVDHRRDCDSHSMSSPRRRGSRAGKAAPALRSTTGSRPAPGWRSAWWIGSTTVSTRSSRRPRFPFDVIPACAGM